MNLNYNTNGLIYARGTRRCLPGEVNFVWEVPKGLVWDKSSSNQKGYYKQTYTQNLFNVTI